MSLPKISTPTYEFSLISSDKKIKFRPFVVGEEKILAMTKESSKFSDRIKAAEEILKSCCLDDIDLTKLPTFDINYLFIQLRSKSVGETLDVMVYSPHKPLKEEIEKCKPTKVTINLEKDLVINKNKKKTKDKNFLIDEESGVGIKLKYISLGDLKSLDIDSKSFSDVLLASIECIYDNDNVYEPSNYKKEELKDWIASIPISKLKNIKEFFDSIPSVSIKVSFECSTCGAKLTETYTDFSDFF